jgi:glutamate formiminotransferase / formiminotetrahydrofolate cyclodeaminase
VSEAAIVECVPNFSEGRSPAVIEGIAAAIRAVPGVSLLDVDPGKATNRTVMTMVGAPEPVLEAAFQAISTAAALVDMSRHHGAHPRIGATDVCPFVPVSGIDMEGCVKLARRLGLRVGKELGIPVYLYEGAATSPERRNLANIRIGEYEGLAAKLADPAWKPDFGPAAFNARSGATVIGAREFLIAFNVNLNTRETRKAMKIAALIREMGIARRDAEGNAIRDENGALVRDPGLFRTVKAIGWFIKEYDRAQISINFTDWRTAPPHIVLDSIRQIADQEGVVVTGAELVGLVPLEAMLEAGRYYFRRQGLCSGLPESDLVEMAIRSMGLRDLGPFDADQRIIERRIRSDGPLARHSIRSFTDLLSSAAPAPGGGSTASLCGALGAGLAAKLGNLTVGKKGYESLTSSQNANAVQAQALKEAFLSDIDRDTAAFDALMSAFALPKKTPEEQAQKEQAIEEATQGATLVPLGVLERCLDVVKCCRVALQGNANAKSDAGVGNLLVRTCAEGAWYNVRINLKGVKDVAFRDTVGARADAVLDQVRAEVEEMAKEVREFLVS